MRTFILILLASLICALDERQRLIKHHEHHGVQKTLCGCHYNYEPVCGVNDKTYMNACLAGCDKQHPLGYVVIKHEGVCGQGEDEEEHHHHRLHPVRHHQKSHHHKPHHHEPHHHKPHHHEPHHHKPHHHEPHHSESHHHKPHHHKSHHPEPHHHKSHHHKPHHHKPHHPEPHHSKPHHPKHHHPKPHHQKPDHGHHHNERCRREIRAIPSYKRVIHRRQTRVMLSRRGKRASHERKIMDNMLPSIQRRAAREVKHVEFGYKPIQDSEDDCGCSREMNPVCGKDRHSRRNPCTAMCALKVTTTEDAVAYHGLCLKETVFFS